MLGTCIVTVKLKYISTDQKKKKNGWNNLICEHSLAMHFILCGLISGTVCEVVLSISEAVTAGYLCKLFNQEKYWFLTLLIFFVFKQHICGPIFYPLWYCGNIHIIMISKLSDLCLTMSGVYWPLAQLVWFQKLGHKKGHRLKLCDMYSWNKRIVIPS